MVKGFVKATLALGAIAAIGAGIAMTGAGAAPSVAPERPTVDKGTTVVPAVFRHSVISLPQLGPSSTRQQSGVHDLAEVGRAGGDKPLAIRQIEPALAGLLGPTESFQSRPSLLGRYALVVVSLVEAGEDVVEHAVYALLASAD